MNAKTLIALQITSFIIMLGTAELLFVKILPSIFFFTSLVIFANIGIYINKNEKWLIKEINNQ